MDLSTNEVLPQPEKYIHCAHCGIILGYAAHVGKGYFLFMFAYPAVHPDSRLADRRINARILSGDAYCVRCGNWQEWAFERPWEARRRLSV